MNYYVETAFANDVLYSLHKISMIAYFSMFNASLKNKTDMMLKLLFQ